VLGGGSLAIVEGRARLEAPALSARVFVPEESSCAN
jgi:hypothetical protein